MSKEKIIGGTLIIYIFLKTNEWKYKNIKKVVDGSGVLYDPEGINREHLN